MPDAVLVTVNGKSLTRGTAMEMAREMAMRQGVPPQMVDQFMQQMGAQVESQAVDQFISKCLLEAEAERLQIQVSEKRVDEVLAMLTQRLPKGVTLEQALQAQGMDLATLRKEIEASERMRALVDSKVAQDQKVTDEQVAAYYKENVAQFESQEEVEARHILVTCDEKADEKARTAAKAEIDDIRGKLAAGADFAETAKASSDCPSKAEGGALGRFGRGQMAPEFEKAAFSQEVGVLGPVVQTQFGYHLVEVTARHPAGTQALATVSEDIKQTLTQQMQQKLFGDYIASLRKGANIQYGAGVVPQP